MGEQLMRIINLKIINYISILIIMSILIMMLHLYMVAMDVEKLLF